MTSRTDHPAAALGVCHSVSARPRPMSTRSPAAERIPAMPAWLMTDSFQFTWLRSCLGTSPPSSSIRLASTGGGDGEPKQVVCHGLCPLLLVEHKHDLALPSTVALGEAYRVFPVVQPHGARDSCAQRAVGDQCHQLAIGVVHHLGVGAA